MNFLIGCIRESFLYPKITNPWWLFIESSSPAPSQKKSVKTRLAFCEQVREEEFQGNSLGAQGKGCKMDDVYEKGLDGVFQSSAECSKYKGCS